MASSVDVPLHQVQESTAQEIEISPSRVQGVLFQLVPYGSLSYCWEFNYLTDIRIPRNYRHVNGSHSLSQGFPVLTKVPSQADPTPGETCDGGARRARSAITCFS